jgi:hypothetical protein
VNHPRLPCDRRPQRRMTIRRERATGGDFQGRRRRNRGRLRQARQRSRVGAGSPRGSRPRAVSRDTQIRSALPTARSRAESRGQGWEFANPLSRSALRNPTEIPTADPGAIVAVKAQAAAPARGVIAVAETPAPLRVRWAIVVVAVDAVPRRVPRIRAAIEAAAAGTDQNRRVS